MKEDECDAGGICDEIANATAGIIASRIRNANTTDGGHDGDDHAWTIVHQSCEQEAPTFVFQKFGRYSDQTSLG